MAEITKEPVGKQDIRTWYDASETARTFTRDNDDGYTLTLNKLDWVGIDVRQMYGGGVIQNSTAIAAAITAIGATNVRNLFFAPIEWSLTQSHTFTANMFLHIPPGCSIDTDMSIRSADYIWTLSGSGTDEYYLQATGGTDPGLSEPWGVAENDSLLTADTAGSLAVSEWDWGDNDTLGYNTVYVRLSDGADPDSKAASYVEACYSLTISGGIIAGPYQWITGNGFVTYNLAGITRAYPEWWGEDSVSNADVSTSGTGEDTLATSTIKRGLMGTVGVIHVMASGTKTLLNGAKTIKFHFGASEITLTAQNNVHEWFFEAWIWNTAAGAQRVQWKYRDGITLGLQHHDSGYEAWTINTLVDVTMKMTGECANASDTITQTMWRWERI